MKRLRWTRKLRFSDSKTPKRHLPIILINYIFQLKLILSCKNKQPRMADDITCDEKFYTNNTTTWIAPQTVLYMLSLDGLSSDLFHHVTDGAQRIILTFILIIVRHILSHTQGVWLISTHCHTLLSCVVISGNSLWCFGQPRHICVHNKSLEKTIHMKLPCRRSITGKQHNLSTIIHIICYISHSPPQKCNSIYSKIG